MNELNPNHLVTKSNELVSASYKLTLLEQKIILAIASMIKPDDKEFKTYKIKIKDFMELLGLNTRTGRYNELQQITMGLMKNAFEIKLPSGPLQLSWFASVQYYEGKGIVEIELSNKLRPYLLELKKKFTSYQLKNVLLLRSNYSIRLYECLKQYEKIGERTFNITQLREILGIEEDKYTLYGHLKSKIILKAQSELKELCDLYFEFEEIKEGRKVVKIKFKIIPQKMKYKEIVESEE